MNKHFSLSAAAAALAIGMGCPAAFATDGYFQDGYGASQKALGGAGVAYTQDATGIALNPAGLVNVDDQIAVSMSLFSPFRSYTAQDIAGVNFISAGEHGSDTTLFAIPDIAWTHHLGPDTVLGVGLYGNGGMDTRYHSAVFGAGFPGGGTAPTGVDLNQAFMTVSLSQRFGQFSVGVAPILAMQTFKAYGIAPFAGLSMSPGNVSDNGFAFSYGGGVRAGIEYDVTPGLRLAVAGSSRIYMTDFDLYKGLYAGGGSFDIPATITAGVSYDIRPNVTVMLDYKHIFYGDIASIANPSTNQAPLGASNGPGFGWSDIDIVKFGVEWRYDPAWTFRAGYSYNTSPLSSRDVMFNILAPATPQNHITGGFKYAWSEKIDIELSAMYAPNGSVKGNALSLPCGLGCFTAAQPIELDMEQYEATIGIVYHFDGRRELEPLK
jgi:long-chain fatty acid transport protein